MRAAREARVSDLVTLSAAALRERGNSTARCLLSAITLWFMGVRDVSHGISGRELER